MMGIGINAGILQNAVPLSAERVQELENQVIEERTTFVYLNEDCEICVSMPHGIYDFKDLAWHNAYELAAEADRLVKKVYKKDKINAYYLSAVFIKTTLDDAWEVTETFYRQLVYQLEQNSVFYLENIRVEELET